jgi:hypothetical protein
MIGITFREPPEQQLPSRFRSRQNRDACRSGTSRRSISVLKIFPTQEAADAERERLSRINAGKNCFYFVAERHTPVESNYRAAVNAIDLHLSINSNGENSPTLLSTQSKTLKIERCGMKYFVELELSRRQTLFE